MRVIERCYQYVLILIRERVLLFAVSVVLAAMSLALLRQHYFYSNLYRTTLRKAIVDMSERKVEARVDSDINPIILATVLDVYETRQKLRHDGASCIDSSRSVGSRCTDDSQVSDGSSAADPLSATTAVHAAAVELSPLLRAPALKTHRLATSEARAGEAVCISVYDSHEPADLTTLVARVRDALAAAAPWTRSWPGWADWSSRMHEFALGKDAAAVGLDVQHTSLVEHDEHRQWYEHEKQFGLTVHDATPSAFRSQLLIPSRLRVDVASTFAADLGEPVPSNRSDKLALVPPKVTCRVAWEASASRLLDFLLEPLLSDPQHLQSETSGSLVQAYFIGVDGLIRYWHSGAGPSPREQFGPVRLWSERASYFTEVLDGKASTGPTLPYLDLGANGLVETRCTSIHAADTPHQSSLVVGAICTDTTVPFSHRPTNAANLARPYRDLDIDVSCRGDGCDLKFESEQAVAAFLEGLALTRDQIKQKILYRAKGAFSKLEVIEVGDTKLSLISVRRQVVGPVVTYHALLLRPDPTPDAYAWLVVVGVALFFAAAIVAVGNIVFTRGVARQRFDTAVLQNLQVGVVATTSTCEHGLCQEWIEGGNDRAEELLGIPLASFGARESNRVRTTAEMFEEPVLMLRKKRSAPVERTDLLPASLSTIAALRRQGVESTFFARPKTRFAAKRWLKVDGAPFATNGQRVPIQTFAILSVVDDEFEKVRLDAWSATFRAESKHDY
jgi:hypothetical protein